MKKSAEHLQRANEKTNETPVRTERAIEIFRRKLGVMWQIHMLSHLMVRRVDPNITGKYGLSLVEWRIVITLARAPGLSANEIIQSWALEKMAVSRGVRRLLMLGLIKRTNEPRGSRRCPLYLTGKGSAIYRASWPDAEADYRRLTSVLSANDLVRFSGLADKLIAQARRVTEDTGKA
jgi:DNA-binding MarR family transcriptional regulator